MIKKFITPFETSSNLLSYETFLFPINDKSKEIPHWYLIVAKRSNHTIYTCNSLSTMLAPPETKTVKNIMSRLFKTIDKNQEHNWRVERNKTCPLQRNTNDCGVFTCIFALLEMLDVRISYFTSDQIHMYGRTHITHQILQFFEGNIHT